MHQQIFDQSHDVSKPKHSVIATHIKRNAPME